jgi:hypothetical protein
MKSTVFKLSALLLFLSLTNFALADDMDDIRNATLAHFAAQNRLDAEARIAHHEPYHSQFADGGLLKVSSSLEGQLRSARTLHGSGIKFNLNLTHMNIKIYDKAAVMTGHVVGTVTKPGGEIWTLKF